MPKTIDNDISFVQRTFGFETAVSEARRATYAANSEAEAARNGIGLVKLMGRDSGFIAAYSVLVDGQVNFCLVPEVPFTLERFLSELRRRLEHRGHAVIVVAEGAGQDLMAGGEERDASGNVKHRDIGVFLRDAIAGTSRNPGRRSVSSTSIPATPSEACRRRRTTRRSACCSGHNAVHAGNERADRHGRGLLEPSVHPRADRPRRLRTRKKIDPEGALWSSVLASTGQPRDMR